MEYRNIQFGVQAGIARLTFNRPERMNSVSSEMNQEIRDVLAHLATDREARVLVLSGAGRAFCAGQDLTEREQVARGEPVDLGDYLANNYNPLILALTNLPIPVIGAVNGVAAGAGASIALACDIVIATRSANFIQAFSKIGLLPDCGGTWMLPRLAGTARALGMTLLAEKISAEQAAQWGLIWRCVDDAAFAETINATATQLAAAPTRALVLTRRAIRESWGRSFTEQLGQESDFQRELGHSRDYAEGVTAFLEKRQPKFSGIEGN